MSSEVSDKILLTKVIKSKNTEYENIHRLKLNLINEVDSLKKELESMKDLREKELESMKDLREKELEISSNLSAELTSTKAANMEYRSELSRIIGSKSWKLTKPLRFIGSLFSYKS